MAQQSLSPSSTAANIVPEPADDGIAYAVAVPLTPTEADVNGGTGVQITAPIPTVYGQAIAAVVKLTANGIIVGNSTYVVMQMDMGDGVWADMCWCFWTGTQGNATFVFSNGIAGANVFQQSRNNGQVPLNSSSVQGNGYNQMALGGRIRFVGRSVMTGGSSSAPGVATQITVTIRYRLQGLR